ncbi:MAG TPA: C45 family peptidase, partial [Planctomycetota bacterium]|nr:C45 family peptidase [Planctomycetota bacterium]
MALRLVLTFCVASAFAASAQQAPESRPASRPVCGSLEVDRGVRVLRLSGTPREQGYAHGYLLAEEIPAFFDRIVVELRLGPVKLMTPKRYEETALSFVTRRGAFSADEEEELAGMLEGMEARLGAPARSAALGRPITLDDLKAGNSFGDWIPISCSSLSTWGRFTADGGTATVRNFDYPPHPELAARALLIARTPADPAKKAWATVGYPAFIGVLSGMSEAGVGLFVHDVNGRARPEGGRLVPRLLALRRTLEALDGKDAPAAALAALRSMDTYVGNNVHVTSPWDGAHAPAGVVEYDGDESRGEGADLRGPEGDAVCCTNHFRLRATPTRCGRYARMRAELEALASQGRKLDAAAGRAVARAAAQNNPFSRTLHTVIFFPGARRFEVMFS